MLIDPDPYHRCNEDFITFSYNENIVWKIIVTGIELPVIFSIHCM